MSVLLLTDKDVKDLLTMKDVVRSRIAELAAKLL